MGETPDSGIIILEHYNNRLEMSNGNYYLGYCIDKDIELNCFLKDGTTYKYVLHDARTLFNQDGVRVL